MVTPTFKDFREAALLGEASYGDLRSERQKTKGEHLQEGVVDGIKNGVLPAYTAYKILTEGTPRPIMTTRDGDVVNPQNNEQLILGYQRLTKEEQKENVKPNNLSETLATDVATRYNMLSHRSETGSGYSGTIFRNKETGQTTLAIRGTADRKDATGADVRGITGDGLPVKQIIDAYNHLAWAKAPQGQRYERAKLENVQPKNVYMKTNTNPPDFVPYGNAKDGTDVLIMREHGYIKDDKGQFVPLKEAYPIDLKVSNNQSGLYLGSRITKELSPTNDTGGGIIKPGEKIVTVGHSLGNAVSNVFPQIDPETVKYNVGINGAGRGTSFDFQAKNVQTVLDGLAGRHTTFDPNKQFSVHGDASQEIVTNTRNDRPGHFGLKHGMGLSHGVENQAVFSHQSFFSAHGSGTITDATQAASPLIALNPGLNANGQQAMQKLLPIMQHSARSRSDCLPQLTKKIGAIYGEKIEIKSDDRNGLNQASKDLTHKLEQQGQKADVKVMPYEDTKGLQKLAREDFGAFYAITQNQSFYLTGGNVDKAYQKNHSELYNQWKADKQLPDNQRNFTNDYLNARIDMYQTHIGQAAASSSKFLNEKTNTPNITHYEAVTKQGTLTADTKGFNKIDVVRFAETKGQTLKQADDVKGTTTLYGGSGNDRLEGGQTVSNLKGGKGFDTYVINTDQTTIKDSDGKGQIEFKGKVLDKEFTPIPGTRNEYMYSGNPNITAKIDPKHPENLNINLGRDLNSTPRTVTIENFKNGDLGIKLANTPQQTYQGIDLGDVAKLGVAIVKDPQKGLEAGKAVLNESLKIFKPAIEGVSNYFKPPTDKAQSNATKDKPAASHTSDKHHPTTHSTGGQSHGKGSSPKTEHKDPQPLKARTPDKQALGDNLSPEAIAAMQKLISIQNNLFAANKQAEAEKAEKIKLIQANREKGLPDDTPASPNPEVASKENTKDANNKEDKSAPQQAKNEPTINGQGKEAGAQDATQVTQNKQAENPNAAFERALAKGQETTQRDQAENPQQGRALKLS